MKQKNLLIFLVDEWAPDAVGYAKATCVKTPHTDNFAEIGTVLTNVTAPSPICIPSRTGMATGLASNVTKSWDNATPYDGKIRGWAHVLKDNDIPVNIFGKIHFEKKDIDYGFKESKLALHAENGIGMLCGSMFKPTFVLPNTEQLLIRSGPGEHIHQEFDDAVISELCEFLQEDHEDPWCAVAGLIQPHFDFVCMKKYFDLYTDEEVGLGRTRFNRDGLPDFHEWVKIWKESVPGFGPLNTEEDVIRARRAYYGMCSRVDFLIWWAMKFVDLETTNVIITSDHGELAGDGRGPTPEQRAGIFGKSQMYRCSVGVPMIVLGDVPKGKVCNTPVSLLDIHDTILKNFGITTEYRNEGVSIFDIANEQDDLSRQTFSQYHAFGADTSSFMIADGYFQLNYYVSDSNHVFKSELYDLSNDPWTLIDISKSYPAIVELYERQLKNHLYPEEISDEAKRDQCKLIESFGSRENAMKVSSVFATKLPEELKIEVRRVNERSVKII